MHKIYCFLLSGQIFCNDAPDSTVLKSQFPFRHACQFIFGDKFYFFRNRLGILKPDLVCSAVSFIGSVILAGCLIPVSLRSIITDCLLCLIHSDCFTGQSSSICCFPESCIKRNCKNSSLGRDFRKCILDSLFQATDPASDPT